MRADLDLVHKRHAEKPPKIAAEAAAAVADEARADGTARAGLEVGFAPGDTMTPSSSA